MHSTLHTEQLTQFIYSLNDKTLTDLLHSVRHTHELMSADRNPDHRFIERQQRLHNEAYHLVTGSVDVAIHRNTPVPYAIADDFCSYLQSLDRGILLARLYKGMTSQQWAKLFVDHWTSIETADYMMTDLRQALDVVGMKNLQDCMDEEDRAHYDALPDELTVYRGCANGGDGFSWTLDLKTAEQFLLRKEGAYSGMMKMRLMVSTNDQGLREDIYNAEPKPVAVYTGTVKKEDCIVFFNRNEQEIFSNQVQSIAVKNN